ncbi:hypothetical protein ABW19_dt0208659 [Dactylella cylindrospora]|nr:hypothetical protein ABW19_dt0208659 [Dactylella cylindrospora]
MTDYFKNVLLIGATGDLGRHILTALLNLSTAHPTQPINLSILTRPSSTSTSTLPSHIKVLRGDITSKSFLSTAFTGQDIIISAISPYALSLQKDMLDVAGQVGVKRFVLGEFGLDTKDVELTDRVRVFQENRRVLEHTEAAVVRYPTLQWTGVICGAFLEMCLLDGELGFEFDTRTARIYDGGRKVMDVSRMGDVAKATAELIFQPGRYAGELVYISSFRVSQRDILDALNRVDEKAPWKVDEKPARWLQERGDGKVEEGDMMGLVDEIWAVAFEDNGVGEAFSGRRRLRNEELGIAGCGEEDFDEVVKGIVGEWEAGRRK